MTLVVSAFTVVCNPLSSRAEIASDNTSSSTGTIVSEEGCSACQITGGIEEGNNLFHSFEVFSVEEAAFFNNALYIENIFSRVTGNQASELNGTISANGNANFFLLNPNGIVFGLDAKLDIGGSFVASTASQLNFKNGSYFSVATLNTAESLLRVSTPVGLQLPNSNASTTSMQGVISIVGELDVRPGNTLALVANEIISSGGTLLAPEGRIELSGVGSNSTVGLTIPEEQGLSLTYDTVESYGDVTLSDGTYIDSSGEGAGAFQIRGRNVTFSGGSLLNAINLGSSASQNLFFSASETMSLSGDFTAFEVWSEGIGRAGDIFIDAQTLSIEKGAYIDIPGVLGEASDISILASNVEISGIDSSGLPGGVFAQAYENYDSSLVGGDVTISADSITVSEGAQIALGTFGAADSGDLLLLAEAVNIGSSFADSSGTGIFNQVSVGVDASGLDLFATGDSGEITVVTDSLTVQRGGQIDSSTSGIGNAGDISVVADSILISGVSDNGVSPTTISTAVIADEQASGDSGTLQIRTQRLTVLDGAQISTVARNEGRGGLLTVEAEEYVLLSGVFQADTREGIESRSSGIFVSAEPGATNDVGTLTISTDILTVEDGAKISADNRGSGNGSETNISAQQVLIRNGGRVGAGSLTGLNIDSSQLGSSGALTLNIIEELEVSGSRLLGGEVVDSELFTRAEGAGSAGTLVINESPDGSLSIIVRDRGEISASTVSSTGGNIVFNNPDVLLLSSGGRLTAEAGAAQNAGDGGNITLNMPDGFIVAAPDENSDIVANAFSGDGGNINITAQNIFGIEQRPATPDNLTNDIDASSQFGNSGTVTFNILELDPTQGLIELPNTLSSSNQVAQRCLADSQISNAFVITGQGGTTPSPRNIVRNETSGLVDLGLALDVAIFANSSSPSFGESVAAAETVPPEMPLIEAQGWQQSDDGTITLLAQFPPTRMPNSIAYLPCSSQLRG